MKTVAFSVLVSLSAFGQEPGHFTNDTPVRANPKSKPPASHAPLLIDQFSRSRGLRAHEVQTIHYNRIACGRRIFSAVGKSIEGDGDLKAVSVPPDFIEVEFPSHVGFDSFGAENPFGNGISDMETVTSRILVKVRDWTDGTPLVLNKRMTLRFQDKDKAPINVSAKVEVRVKDGTYPSTYIIRETVEGPSRFTLYYICQ